MIQKCGNSWLCSWSCVVGGDDFGKKRVLVPVLVTWTSNQVLAVLCVQNGNFSAGPTKIQTFECGVLVAKKGMAVTKDKEFVVDHCFYFVLMLKMLFHSAEKPETQHRNVLWP